MWRRRQTLVGRFGLQAAEGRTGAIEAEGGTPKFTPNDSCPVAHGPMQLALWVVMVLDFVNSFATLHEAEDTRTSSCRSC